MLLWRFLQIRSFFWNDRRFHWADLNTDAAVYAGGKVNPVPVVALHIFGWAFVNASYWAGINTIGNAFTDISHNRVRHRVLSENLFDQLVNSFSFILTKNDLAI